MLKYLRIAVTALSLTACVVLSALWVRSHTTRDSVFWPWTDHALQANSLKGHVVLCLVSKGPSSQWVLFKIQHVTIGQSFKTLFDNNVLGFYFERKPNEVRVDIPCWFVVVTCLMIAVTPWLREKWRFGLRTLLIAATLVAVALGIVAMSS